MSATRIRKFQKVPESSRKFLVNGNQDFLRGAFSAPAESSGTFLLRGTFWLELSEPGAGGHPQNGRKFQKVLNTQTLAGLYLAGPA